MLFSVAYSGSDVDGAWSSTVPGVEREHRCIESGGDSAHCLRGQSTKGLRSARSHAILQQQHWRGTSRKCDLVVCGITVCLVFEDPKLEKEPKAREHYGAEALSR